MITVMFLTMSEKLIGFQKNWILLFSGESIFENRGLQIFPVLHDFVAKNDMYRLYKKKKDKCPHKT